MSDAVPGAARAAASGRSGAADPFARAEASAAALKKLTGVPHFDAAVVLGSGWMAAADAIGAPEREIALADLGGFPPPTVEGHTPAVRYLIKGDLNVLLFLGRVHMYEGHAPHTVVHGVRTAIAAGCRTVVLTNAAGGIRAEYAVGEPVLISDHLNLTGRSPLSGPPPPKGYPSRFTDLTQAYSARLRALAREQDRTLAEGVYAALPGPHYETPAEIRMLRTAGADLGRHVHRARGDSGAPPRGGSARDLTGHEPGGRPDRRTARPRGSPGRRPGLRHPHRHPALNTAPPPIAALAGAPAPVPGGAQRTRRVGG